MMAAVADIAIGVAWLRGGYGHHRHPGQSLHARGDP